MVVVIGGGLVACSGTSSEEVASEDALKSDVAAADTSIPTTITFRTNTNGSPEGREAACVTLGEHYVLTQVDWLVEERVPKALLLSKKFGSQTIEALGGRFSATINASGECEATAEVEYFVPEDSAPRAMSPIHKTMQIDRFALNQLPWGTNQRFELNQAVNVAVHFAPPVRAPRVYPEYTKYLEDGTMRAALVTPKEDFAATIEKLTKLGYEAHDVTGLRWDGASSDWKPYVEENARSFTKWAGSVEARVDVFSASLASANQGTLVDIPMLEAFLTAEIARSPGRMVVPVHVRQQKAFEREQPSATQGPDKSFMDLFTERGWPKHQVWVDTFADENRESTGFSAEPTNEVWMRSPESADVDIVRQLGRDLKPAATSLATIDIFERLTAEVVKAPAARQSWNAILRSLNDASKDQRLVGWRMDDNSPPSR